jgi:hypothetical protein
MLRAAVLVIALSVSSGVEAELCKYIDESGHIHYLSASTKSTWRLVECFDGDILPERTPILRTAGLGVGPLAFFRNA